MIRFKDEELKRELVAEKRRAALDLVKSAVKRDDAAKARIPTGKIGDKVKIRKRGRPIAPKPWIEAGVSRMTWYRRAKKVKGELK